MVAEAIQRTSVGARSVASHPRTRRTTLVAFVFLVATLLWFLPLVLHLHSRILLGPTDAAAGIRGYWAAAHLHQTPFTTHHDPLLGAPEGVPFPGAPVVAQPIQAGFVWLLHGAVGFVAAFNLFVLLGFVLTGVAAYLFLEGLGLRPLAAFFGSYVIAFNPWTFQRALAGHAAFVHVWVLILLAAALLAFRRSRTLPRAVLAGLAYGLTFQMASYWGLLATLLTLVFFAGMLLEDRSARERVHTVLLGAVGAAILALTLVPALLAYRHDRTGVDRIAGHGLEDLTQFAATVKSYLLPNRSHPVLGFLGRDFLNSNQVLFSERSLFFGWTTLAAALVTTWLLLRRREALRRDAAYRFALAAFAVVALAAFLTSLPPYADVLGLHIPMPAWVAGHITTFYRVYARFGILFGFAVAVLAAAAVDLLLRLRRGTLLATALFALTVFQLLPGAITTWAADSPPPWDAWLAKAPPGIVAQYPMPLDDDPSRLLANREQYYQRFHEHPLYVTTVTGGVQSREGAIRLLSRNLTDADTASVLAAEHVRYIVVHDDVYRAAGHEPPHLGAPYRQVARFGPVHVYVLGKTQPADVNALIRQQSNLLAQLQNLATVQGTLGDGWYPGEHYSGAGSPDELWHWMNQNGEVTFDIPDQVGVTYTLTALGFSSMTPRALDLIGSDGKVAAETTVPTNLGTIDLGPIALSPGTHRFRLYVNPLPAPLGGSDTRVASVFFSPIELQPLPLLTPLNGTTGG